MLQIQDHEYLKIYRVSRKNADVLKAMYFLQCTSDSSVFTEESFHFLAICSFPFGSSEDAVLL